MIMCTSHAEVVSKLEIGCGGLVLVACTRAALADVEAMCAAGLVRFTFIALVLGDARTTLSALATASAAALSRGSPVWPNECAALAEDSPGGMFSLRMPADRDYSSSRKQRASARGPRRAEAEAEAGAEAEAEAGAEMEAEAEAEAGVEAEAGAATVGERSGGSVMCRVVKVSRCRHGRDSFDVSTVPRPEPAHALKLARITLALLRTHAHVCDALMCDRLNFVQVELSSTANNGRLSTVLCAMMRELGTPVIGDRYTPDYSPFIQYGRSHALFRASAVSNLGPFLLRVPEAGLGRLRSLPISFGHFWEIPHG